MSDATRPPVHRRPNMDADRLPIDYDGRHLAMHSRFSDNWRWDVTERPPRSTEERKRSGD